MGLSYSPSPEEKRKQELYELHERINYQREKEFQKLLLELYEIKENFPKTIISEKKDCGRPTYIMKEESRNYCPECGGGVQRFIENKVVKILNIQNKIYPLYSDLTCLKTTKKPSKPFCLKKAEVEILSDEKGEYYFFVNGNKYYFTDYATYWYKNKSSQDPLFFLYSVITEHNHSNQEELQFIENYGYEFYEYQNPLRNHDTKKALIYYRCVKCHLEYHLYTPFFDCYLYKLKTKGEEKVKEGIKDANLGNENEKEINKEASTNNEKGKENEEKNE